MPHLRARRRHQRRRAEDPPAAASATGSVPGCIDDSSARTSSIATARWRTRAASPGVRPARFAIPNLDVCELGLFCVPTVDNRFACGRAPRDGRCHRLPAGNGCLRPLKCESAPPNPDGGIGRCIAGGLMGEPCDDDCFEGACRADGGVRVCIPPRLDGFPCTGRSAPRRSATRTRASAARPALDFSLGRGETGVKSGFYRPVVGG